MKPTKGEEKKSHSEEANIKDEATTKLLAKLTVCDPKSLTYMTCKNSIMEKFSNWSSKEQTEFVKALVYNMESQQLGEIHNFLEPLLKKDFLSLLPDRVTRRILTCIDASSLRSCEMVCHYWRSLVANNRCWRKLIEQKILADVVWRKIAEKRGWKKFLFQNKEMSHFLVLRECGFPLDSIENIEYSYEMQNSFYRDMHTKIEYDIRKLKNNWKTGRYEISRIFCHSEPSRGVYCLQYDDEKIISGLRDHTIRIWTLNHLQCIRTLRGHSGSVLCLQYDEKIIISGSSDTTVRTWNVETGELLFTLVHHVDAVLHLRFNGDMMVTCSKDRSIAVWTINSPTDIKIRRVLLSHRAAVNVVDFDTRYIVSASGDRSIKVWNTATCEYLRTMSGHRRGIACLQYRDRLVASGSSDNTIRLWDVETGSCLRVLEGHEQLVRCIRFDAKRIISGAYDGRIKVWDLQAALDPQSPPDSICTLTLSQHTGRVFRLQFDDFQIISSSHDDTILIWNFMDVERDVQEDVIMPARALNDQHNGEVSEDEAVEDAQAQQERVNGLLIPVDEAQRMNGHAVDGGDM